MPPYIYHPTHPALQPTRIHHTLCLCYVCLEQDSVGNDMNGQAVVLSEPTHAITRDPINKITSGDLMQRKKALSKMTAVKFALHRSQVR